MTNRNELERLLAAATEGPWAVGNGGYSHGAVFELRAGDDGDWYIGEILFGCSELEPTIPPQDAAHANAALICFLRNNAHHYLSLMDEVERLREAVAKIGAIAAKPTYPGNNLRDIHLIARQALGETHDN